MDDVERTAGGLDWKRIYPWLIVLAVAVLLFLYLPALVGRVSYARAAAEVRAVREGMSGLAAGDTLSPLFAAVSKSVKPAVVVIRTSARVQVQPEPDLHDFLRRFFGEGAEPEVPRQYYFRQGIGSGIIVDKKNGYVLTNWHVVHGAETAEVMLADGRTLQAEWAKTDRKNDLAIVKIKPAGLISVPMGDSDKVRVGDMVLAIGAPEGLPQTVTAGIISAMGRRTGDSHESFLQTDAAINPGNSGGPLVNMDGHVIGINTAIISPVGVNAGIGLAIPSNVARNVMAELVGTKAPAVENADGERKPDR